MRPLYTRPVLSADPKCAIRQLLREIVVRAHHKAAALHDLKYVKDMATEWLVETREAPAKAKRKRKRNPNTPSAIRSAAWFDRNRRDRVDEPGQAQSVAEFE